MQVRHVEEVKKSLGNSTVELLTAIFEQSTGLPPGVPATRFRAKHLQWMDQLNNLGHAGDLWVKPEHTNDTYRVSAYALPIVDSTHACEILTCMEAVYKYLRGYYYEHLREPIRTDRIEEAVKIERTLLLESLYYMRDVSGWWSGLSNDFPFKADASIVVNEQVLKYNSLGDLISRAYEWNYVNPKQRADTWYQLFDERSTGNRGFFSVDDYAQQPAWFSELDDLKKAMIGEIDIAIRNSLLALPTMGLRTLLERVMVEHIGEDGGFSEKLERFQQNGYVTVLHADNLRKVLDVGNASAHRAYFPNEQDVRTCVEVVKHLMHSLYVLHPKVQKMSQSTPPDPRKKNRTGKEITTAD